MPKISDNVTVEVNVTPHELGKIFAAMDSVEQAQFFDGLATEIATWSKPGCFQWQHLLDELDAYPRGMNAFKGLAEYAL